MSESCPVDEHRQPVPIVLLHGWGMNAAVWQQLQLALAPLNLPLLAVDLPGFGGAAELTDPTDIELMAAQLWQQLPPRCHLVGWSLGGLVATQMALLEPARALSLCTIASSPAFQASSDWPGIKPAVLGGFAQQLQQDIDKTLAGFFMLQGMGSDSGRADIRQLKQAVMAKPKATNEALAGGLQMLQQVDLRPRLAELQLPWLRIYGRNDALVPKSMVPLMDQLAPQSQSLIIAKAGHAPFISHQAQVAGCLLDFYRG